ncbi:MAG: helix-hairpin-helix domain-containing protein [Arthrobacter sp.]
MPRHDPGVLSSAEAVHTGRRLSTAVRSDTVRSDAVRSDTVRSDTGRGQADEPPLLPPAVDNPEPGPDRSPTLSRIRWRTGGRAAALLCLLAAAVLVWFWWQASSTSAEVSPLSSVPVAEEGDGPARESETGQASGAGRSLDEGGGGVSGKIIVHVAGAVVRPGIVELARGSRLHEALAAAGGSVPDADPGQLNLAAVLEDGQKIAVPRQGETVPPEPAPAGGSGAPGSSAGSSQGGDASPAGAGMVNLNTAGAEELATLPRVGPVLAQRIVAWRTEHGRFQRVEELDAVEGVGPKLLAALLPLVRV